MDFNELSFSRLAPEHELKPFDCSDSYKSYPAIKIGRVAVNSNFQGQGIGNMIIDYLKQLFIENNRTGCQFITVDA